MINNSNKQLYIIKMQAKSNVFSAAEELHSR